MALADQSLRGNPEIFALFAHRLPQAESQEQLDAIYRDLSGHERVAWAL